MSCDRYLPANLARGNLAAVVGLLSDTHMPQRRRALPENLADVLGGVDFLLHAGDVGELWVLDQLSAIAPVFAVHGNDDTDDAQRELPFQQIITIAGQRILLWHSHYPNWDEEMASRSDEDLHRTLQRSVDQAQRAGANVVVFGHWHIPLVKQVDGILTVNPGALASGNEFTRMLRNTVALLFVERSGVCHVNHVDLGAPDAPFTPQIDWDAGFTTAANHFTKSILAADLAPLIRFLRAHLTRQEILMIRPPVAAIAHPIWENEGGELTLAAVEDALLNTNTLPPELHARVQELWHAWQNSR
jgi:putative phosphoesterase